MISAADDVERVEEELDFAWAGSVVDRVGVIRDSVYLAQAPGGSPPPAPHDIEGSSGWTRKPVAPTSALPVVWQAYREANLNGEVNLAWSDWSVPELYAVESDSTVAGFTTQVDLEFQALALDSSVVATSGDFIEPTYAAPLIEVRQRFRASSTDAFPDWDEAVHRWTAVGRLTPGGVRCGVLAELDTGFACDPDQERTIYRRSVSHLPPASPTGNAAVPPGWYGEERIATSSLPCVYRLTVRAPDCVWPDWSTAGTPVLHDEWTARYFWWITTEDVPPQTPTGLDPYPWMPSRPNLTMPPQCRWVALRAGSPLGGYFWGAPEDDGKRLETTIYMRSASAAIPANPTSTDEAPSGWSIERLCATAVERYAYSLTVVPVNSAWPWAMAEPAVLFDEWTETPYWRLTATDAAPPAPTGDEPADWTAERPETTTSLPYRWISTREGSECEGHTWTTPEADLDIVTTRYAYKLSPSEPATPSGTSYPPPGWSTTDLETTKEESVWWTGQTVTNGVGSVWSSPERWKWLQCAYKVATSQPAPPTSSSYPPPGWSELPHSIGPGESLWVTSRTVTDTSEGSWGVPAFVEGWTGEWCVYKLASSQPMPPTDSTLSDWSEDLPNQTETMRVWRSCRTVIEGVGGPWSTPETVFPDPRTVYKLSSSKPATPSNRFTYPPPGWSLVELEPTTSFNLWQSTQVFVYGIYAPWGEPRFVRGHTGPRYAYKLAASQPATPTSRAWPPPGWRAEPLQPTSSANVWQTTQMLTNGVPGEWSTPELAILRPYTQYTYRLSGSRTTAPALPPSGPNSGGWNGDPDEVVPTATLRYRWRVGRDRPAGPPGTVFGPWGVGTGNAPEVDQTF